MLLSRELILFVSAQFRTTRTDTPKRSSKKWLCPSIRSSERPHFRQGVNNSLLSEASSLLGGMVPLASESGCIISPRPFRESLKLPSSPEVSQKREVTSRRVISYLKQPSLDVMPTHYSASAEVASIPRRATLLDLLCHRLQSLGCPPLHPPEVWRSPPRAVGTTAPLVLHAA